MRLSMPGPLRYGVWAVVVAVAPAPQAIPAFLVLAMFGLAVGVPRGPALLLVPLAVIFMLFAACVVATRPTRRAARRGAGKTVRPRRLFPRREAARLSRTVRPRMPGPVPMYRGADFLPFSCAK